MRTGRAPAAPAPGSDRAWAGSAGPDLQSSSPGAHLHDVDDNAAETRTSPIAQRYHSDMARRCVESDGWGATGAQWAAVPPPPALPPLSSRHPILIVSLEPLRAVLVLTLTGLSTVVPAWFVAIALLKPLSAVLGWAGPLLSAASGWELTIGLGLP